MCSFSTFSFDVNDKSLEFFIHPKTSEKATELRWKKCVREKNLKFIGFMIFIDGILIDQSKKEEKKVRYWLLCGFNGPHLMIYLFSHEVSISHIAKNLKTHKFSRSQRF